jgi:penicillin-binding protein 2
VVLQQESNKQLIQQRLSLFRLPVLLIFLILGARLWQLQIIQGSEYTRRAEQNRIRLIELAAPRGIISDRNNIPLAENQPSFDVLLYREWMKDEAETVRFLTQKLGIKEEDVEERFRKGKSDGFYRPIVVKENAGMEDISVIEAHKGTYPEIQSVPGSRRLYRHGKLAAHILGYVGEITEEELTSNIFPEAKSGSLVGRSGVERIYNQFLVGEVGERQILVDSKGREIGILKEEEPIVGNGIRLTVDFDLQSVAEDALEGKVGAIAAMDPRSGEILAMVSSPAFDPNSFSAHISQSDWNELVRHPDHPMQNRAIQNSHAPGSLFKLIMASAGLADGAIGDSTTVLCKGSAVYYGRVFQCASTDGHGSLGLEDAIARSCNIYFYELGRRLGIEKIAEHGHLLGLGLPTGIDLPEERSGVMPSPEWKREARGERWYSGETISVSIGQGAVNTTPLQILRAVSAIATGGMLTTPHVLLEAEGSLDDRTEWPINTIPIDDKNARRIREGMWRSVNRWGTGHRAAVPGQDICGKTGTAQVVGSRKNQESEEKIEDHAWFVGFGNRDNPEIAVVVFVEHGGTGGVAAAPIAQKIFSAYFDKYGPQMLTHSQASAMQMPETAKNGSSLISLSEND